MRIICRQLAAVVFLAAFSACQKQADNSDVDAKKPQADLSAGVYYGDGQAALSELPQDAVLLRVNGVSFTRSDFELDQDVYCMMSSYLRSGKIDTDSKDFRKLKAMRAPAVLNMLLRRELFNQEARRRNLKASEAAVAVRRGELESLLSSNQANTNGVFDVDALASQMGADCGRYFLETLNKDAENLELSWQTGGDRIKVSEDEVTEGSNRLARANALVTATNDVLKARLFSALDRVRAGEDFAAVGSELSMFDKDDARDWGVYSTDDFEGVAFSDVGRFLDTHPASGTVAGPFQCDDGMSIVKVLEVIQNSGSDESADEVEEDEPTTKYRLARISVETFEYHKDHSRSEIRKILEDAKRKKFEAEFGRQLYESAVIEFPSGTNLFRVAASREPESVDLTQTEH